MLIRSMVMLLLAGLLWVAPPSKARAAESFDGCKGYVTSLPATIATSGTWCLKQNLTSNFSGGTSINIAAKDVTLDCNDFVLDNSMAGPGTKAVGVRAAGMSNTTVRHCNIRGFQYGIYVLGANGGNLVEDNHLDGNTYAGILLQGDGSLVRHNVVIDTGGSSIVAGAYGIYASNSVDILDNTVAGVFASGGDRCGIRTSLNAAGSVSGNRIRNVASSATGTARGICNVSSGRMTLAGNTVSGDGSAASIGIVCSGPGARLKDNVVVGFGFGVSQCGDAGGNDIAP